MAKRRIVSLILGSFLTVLGGVSFLFFNTNNPHLVISLGIINIMYFQIVSALIFFVGVLLLVSVVGFIVYSRVKMLSTNRKTFLRAQNSKRDDMEIHKHYGEDSFNPEFARARLTQLCRNTPCLSDIVKTCLAQMDKMDDYQERQRTLIECNDAVYLNDTISVLDSTEHRMYYNIRNIINCCILVEGSDANTNMLDMDIINTSIQNNEKELSDVKTLLQYSVSYINAYNTDGSLDRSELDAWLSTIKKNKEKDVLGDIYEI